MHRQKGSKGKTSTGKARSAQPRSVSRSTHASSTLQTLSSTSGVRSISQSSSHHHVDLSSRRTISTSTARISRPSSAVALQTRRLAPSDSINHQGEIPAIITTQHAAFSKKAAASGGKSKPKAKAADTNADAQQIAEGLTRDIRARVAEYKLRKPSLEERLKNTVGLYEDKPISQVNEDDIGKLIKFDIASQDDSMRHYLKHEEKHCDGFWMIRPQTIAAMDFIDSQVDKINLPRRPKADQLYTTKVANIGLLHGHRGTGKSFTMAQAAQYAREQGWIVVSTTGYDTIHDMQGVIKPTIQPGREGSYDQLLKARLFLEKLAEAYPEMLKQIPLQQTHYEQYGNWMEAEDVRYNAPKNLIQTGEFYPWPANHEVIPRPTERVGKTLFDLAAMGAWRCDLAPWAATDTLRELKRQTQFPVLIAIDDFNAMDQMSDFINPAKLRYRLEANRLTFVQALHECLDEPPHRGATLISTSSHFTQFRVPNLMERAGVHIQSIVYDNIQTQGMLEHYHQSKFILTNMDIEFLRRAEIVTGSNPRDLRAFATVQ